MRVTTRTINKIAASDYGYTAAIHAKEGNEERARELAAVAANRAHRAGYGKRKKKAIADSIRFAVERVRGER